MGNVSAAGRPVLKISYHPARIVGRTYSCRLAIFDLRSWPKYGHLRKTQYQASRACRSCALGSEVVRDKTIAANSLPSSLVSRAIFVKNRDGHFEEGSVAIGILLMMLCFKIERCGGRT